MPAMMRLRFLAVALLGLVMPCLVLAQPTVVLGDGPKLTSRPLNPSSTQMITTLDEKAAFALSQAAIGRDVKDHTLLNREGNPVRLADLRGKPLLVSFMYTGCFQVCPTTTKNLQAAIEKLVASTGPDRFSVVSIGFNQPFDTPQAMKAFALQNGIRLPNWEFLSPAAALVPELTRDFGFSYVQTTAGFDHLNQVTVVDANGIIARQFYGESFGSSGLADAIRTLLDGGTLPPSRDTVEDLFDKVRILCSVYDPVSGKYRLDYRIVFELAGGATFILWILWFAWSERRSRKNSRASG